MGAGMAVALNLRPLFSSAFRQNLPYSAKLPSFPRVSISPKLSLESNSTAILRASHGANEANSGHGGPGINFSSANVVSASLKALLDFIGANFLPVALISAVSLGIAFPALGCQACKYSLSKCTTFGIFFISGIRLQDGEVAEISKALPAVVYGLASIMLVGALVSRLLLNVQMMPQEFATGLALFSCMPTTLTSGVALVQLAGANAALALTLTVMSNLLGTFFVPLWVSEFLAKGFHVTIPAAQLFRSLLIALLVPLVLGKVCRNSFQGLARFSDQNRKALSMTSTILLSLTPWMQVSKSRDILLKVEPLAFIGAMFIGIGMHLSLLLLNSLLVKWLSSGNERWNSAFAKTENARALILVCSQRVLLIAVAVIEQLGGALGEPGLLVLPCVAAHINQIIIDSFLVNFWLQKDGISTADKKP